MRIGMILDAPFPPDERVQKEAISLIEAGHQVFLFSLDYQGGKKEEDVHGIQVRRYGAGKLVYKLSALAYTFPFYSWLVTPRIADFINRNKIEVLHVHDMVIADAVRMANRRFELPLVLDLHENRPAIMKAYRHVNTGLGKILINLMVWRKKYYEFAKEADCVVVVTPAAKEDILRNTGKKPDEVVVVPNTVAKDDFLNRPVSSAILERMKGTYNLLYIGDTSVRRGTDTAIRSVMHLKDAIPEIRLWLVGRSSADAELKRLTRELGLTSYVYFEGWQAPELLNTYITGAHVTLSPLARNEHHDTTYANKVFQYMAMGKPVVASDCTAQEVLLKETNSGLIFESGNDQELARCVRRLFDNKALALTLGDNGKQAVLNYWHWENTVRSLRDMYRRLGTKKLNS
jgi:glycosyltransferase involved in cell wall biosynthesis